MVTLRSCFPMLPHCLPAGNSGQQHLPDGSSPLRPCQQHLPDGSLPQRPRQQYLPDGSSPRRPGQQYLPDGSSPQRPRQQYLPDGALPQCRHPLRHGTPGQQLRYGAPASNSSITAPLPATNLIRRRRVLRFG